MNSKILLLMGICGLFIIALLPVDAEPTVRLPRLETYYDTDYDKKADVLLLANVYNISTNESINLGCEDDFITIDGFSLGYLLESPERSKTCGGASINQMNVSDEIIFNQPDVPIEIQFDVDDDTENDTLLVLSAFECPTLTPIGISIDNNRMDQDKDLGSIRGAILIKKIMRGKSNFLRGPDCYAKLGYIFLNAEMTSIPIL